MEGNCICIMPKKLIKNGIRLNKTCKLIDKNEIGIVSQEVNFLVICFSYAKIQ
jgi:hypothetical protein